MDRIFLMVNLVLNIKWTKKEIFSHINMIMKQKMLLYVILQYKILS